MEESQPKSDTEISQEDLQKAEPEEPAYLPEEDESPVDYVKRQVEIIRTCKIRINSLIEMYYKLRRDPLINEDDLLFVTLVQYKRLNELMKHEAAQRIANVQRIVFQYEVLDHVEKTTFDNWKDEIEWELWNPINRKGGYYEILYSSTGKKLKETLKFDDEDDAD